MDNSGVPIYVTELDLKGKIVSEAGQLLSYQTSFPVYWNHPAVAGITLWGYVEGTTWAAGTGILNSNGTERSAMTWLKTYMEGLPDVGFPFSDNTGTTGIEDFEGNHFFSVFPNPVVTGKVNIAANSGGKLTAIEIFNMKGMLVKSFQPNHSKVEIEVSDLDKGLYYFKVKTESNVTSRKILILQ